MSDRSEQSSPPRDNSTVAATISAEMVRIHRESYGSGAKGVKTYVHDDLVLSVLDVELLPAETAVIASGRRDLVLEMRSSFQLELETSFTAAVERATGRQVIAFLSDTHLDPPFVTELFRLGPPHAVALAEPEAPQTIRGQLHATSEAGREARDLLATLEPHLKREEFDALRLVVSELAANAALHPDSSAHGPIDLEIVVSDAMVRVEVRDGGAGFDPPPLTGDVAIMPGRGLLIVDRLATRWGVTADPTTRVWAEIDRRRT